MKILKEILALALALCTFTACTENDNDKNTYNINNAETVPVEQIFNGCDELQGKDLGKIKLPEKIDSISIDEVYTFPFEPAVSDNEAENSKSFFKAMFGDEYNEINWKQEADRVYIYNSDNGYVSFFRNNCPENYYSNERGSVNTTEVLGTYYADTDKEKIIELKNGECSIGEICDRVSDCISSAFFPLYDGFQIYPYIITHILDDNMEKCAEVTCAVSYNGMMLEPFFSSLFEVEERSEYKVVTNYVPSHMLFYLDGKDNIIFFTNRFGTKEMNVKKLDKLISLEGAVTILLDNLADKSRYNIEQVTLYYCCKNTAPSPVEDEELNSKMEEDFKNEAKSCFEPTWCFIWHTDDGRQQDIKVNAVTGEITMEL
ncbi:MAG: hypothetical protein IJ696_08450 [Ruminococcus sp.]|nr:hypothetical protein [Ruminococcus sp.]